MRVKMLWDDFWQEDARYEDNEGDVWRAVWAPLDVLVAKRGAGKPGPALVLEWLEAEGDAAPVVFHEVATRAALGPLKRLPDLGGEGQTHD